MAALIKNQIIKRLSKFVKNLSSNQINLSTLKGEGELSSINLDEKALEDVVELPTWLKIQKATCGRVFIKIPWTNLKTLPIQIQLDDVLIEIETCEKLRDLHKASNTSDQVLGKYGFTNRVIDGISLSITNLTFAIKAQHFKASICLPSLDIYSTAPNGKRVDTLTLTRLRNSTKDHILLFKEISWPNARIEASSNDNNVSGTAIRFIANSCRIRISMKKNLQDSSLVASRLTVQFDDLLSVVNDAQLKSLLFTYQEITQLINKASDQRKRNASDKLMREKQSQPSPFQPKSSVTNVNDPVKPFVNQQQQQFNDIFARYDMIETSLHFNIKRLDLHIVADLTNQLVENGSVQMTLANLSIDHYPYHEYGSSKKHWNKYNENQSLNRTEWVNKLYDDWSQQFNIAKASVPNDEVSGKFEKALRTNRIRLFESCTVFTIDDLVFYPVSLNNDKQQKRRRPLIASDKIFYQLPDTLGIINIQFSDYYYPLPYSFPVPNNDLYIQIMPLVFRVDFTTISWLIAFVSTLSITIESSGVLKNDKPPINHEHLAIKFEAMLPRIVISSDIFQKFQVDKQNQQEFETLELNVSKVLITNTRTDSTSNRTKLEQHLHSFKKTNFFQQTQWPFSKTTTTPVRISPLFEKHPYETYLFDNPLSKKTSNLPEAQSASKALHTYYTMTTDSLKKAAKYDIWHFNVENVYLDYTPASSESMRFAKQNMIDGLSLTGWIVSDKKEKSPWINILGILENPAMLKISQKQFTFIAHLGDELGLFFDKLKQNNDALCSTKPKSASETISNPAKITICLTTSTTFTLTVLDGSVDEIVNPATPPPPPPLPEVHSEPIIHDRSDMNPMNDPLTTPTNLNKNIKKTKVEENNSRTLELPSRGSRASLSLSSSMTASDYSDETLSQLDMTEDLDADLDPSLFFSDTDQQDHKIACLQLDDDDEDSVSLIGKNSLPIATSGTINGVFVKLNQINICITEDEETSKNGLYIACNAKYIRIDEFTSLKLDGIKPKLFENEPPDQFNNETVPPINVRIDLAKDESAPSSPPLITLHIQDRILSTTSHAIDIIAQNLEEIFTPEERILRQTRPPKRPPIDIHLKNVQITLEPLQNLITTKAIVETKRPAQLNIESMHILRHINGQVIFRDDKKLIIPSLEQSSSENNSEETLRDLEFLRLENERLRSELNLQKTELTILRSERDSLTNTISKLDIELTQAEYLRIAQQQQQQPRKN